MNLVGIKGFPPGKRTLGLKETNKMIRKTSQNALESENRIFRGASPPPAS